MSRDLSDKQFREALKRNDFGRPILFWCEDKKNPGHSYGMVVGKSGKLYKRETIAHLLASRKATELAKVKP